MKTTYWRVGACLALAFGLTEQATRSYAENAANQPAQTTGIQDPDLRMRTELGQEAARRAAESGQIDRVARGWTYDPQSMALFVRQSFPATGNLADGARIPHAGVYFGREMDLGGAILNGVELQVAAIAGRPNMSTIAPTRLQYREPNGVITLQPLESTLRVQYRGETVALRDLPNETKAEIQANFFRLSMAEIGTPHGEFRTHGPGGSNSCVDAATQLFDRAVAVSGLSYAGPTLREFSTSRIGPVTGANPTIWHGLADPASGLPRVETRWPQRQELPRAPVGELRWVPTADFGEAIRRNDGRVHGLYTTPDRVVNVPIWRGVGMDADSLARGAAEAANVAGRRTIVVDSSMGAGLAADVAGRLQRMGFTATCAVLGDDPNRTVAGRGGNALVVVPTLGHEPGPHLHGGHGPEGHHLLVPAVVPMPQLLCIPMPGGAVLPQFLAAPTFAPLVVAEPRTLAAPNLTPPAQPRPGTPGREGGVSMEMEVAPGSFKEGKPGELDQLRKEVLKSRPPKGGVTWPLPQKGEGK